MSGPKTASYQISAVEQARLREHERLLALRLRWQAAHERHDQLRLRAAALRDNHGFAPPVVTPLAEVDAPSADQLEAALVTASAVLSGGEAELSQHERMARDTITRKLIAEVVQPPPPGSSIHNQTPTVRPGADPAVAETLKQDLAKTVQIMARLDTEIEPPKQLTMLVTAVAQAEPGRRRILINQLSVDVSTLNADAHSRRTQATMIAKAGQVAQQTDDHELRNLVAQALTTERDRSVVNLATLRSAVGTALRRAAAGRERQFVEQVVIDAFTGLDYEVLTGFEVQTPDAGALVRRDSTAGHAIRVVVRNGGIDVEAVRTRRDPLLSRADDLRAKQELCDVAPRLWRALLAKGVDINGVTSVPIGNMVTPLGTVTEHATADPAPPTAPRWRW